MNDPLIQDLVDRYLLGQINPEDKERLHRLMEADPVVAQYVKECEDTFKVLQAAKNRELLNKLRVWDTYGESKSRNLTQKGMLALTIFFICAISFWCWLGQHFSSVTLAEQSFKAIPELSIPNPGDPVSLEKWRSGIEDFKNHDFEKAIFSFESCLTDEDSLVVFHARWNILLCQLALQGPTTGWLDAFDFFSKSAPDPWRAEALRLLHKLHSPVYNNLYRGVFHKAITSVKPKII